jgi:hypothetical protein
MDQAPESNELDIALEVDPIDGLTRGTGHGRTRRFQVRVEMHPVSGEVPVIGAHVALLDMDGESMGPTVVLPISGSVREDLSLAAQLQTSPGMSRPTGVRCTVFLSCDRPPLVVERSLVQPRGFKAFLEGISSLEAGTAPDGRSLSAAELERLRLAFPWLGPPEEDDGSFDAFKEDFVSALDLGDSGETTEEILRLLRDD